MSGVVLIFSVPRLGTCVPGRGTCVPGPGTMVPARGTRVPRLGTTKSDRIRNKKVVIKQNKAVWYAFVLWS